MMAYMLMLIVLGSMAEVHTLDGRVILGEPVEGTTGENLQMEEEGGLLTVLDFREICALYLPGAPSPHPTRVEAGVALVDGSILGGTIAHGDDEVLFFSHASLGALKIPIDLIAVLTLADPILPRDFDFYPSRADDDVVYKRGHPIRARDHISGTLVRFSTEGLEFDSTLGELAFAYKDLEALTLAQSEEPDPMGGLPVLLIFRNGLGVIRARLERIQREEVLVSTLFHKDLVIKLEALDSILFQGKGFHYLSDVEPTEVVQTPYLGGEDLFLYPLRADRSVTGHWLACGGRIFAKGLGLHSKTVCGYALDGGYQAFESYLGISDEVLDLPAEGSVRFVVHVDGKKVYQSPVVRSGSPPLKMPRIDLKEAKRLEITVDFADGFDSGDRALLGNPVLVKSGR